MHCPRCGQQQVSDEIKFCSKCGLPLGVVYEVVKNGGTLPQLFELQNKSTLLTKSNGAKFSLIWFLFWCFLATPLLAILGGEEIVAVTAVLGFVGAVFILIGSLLFLKNGPGANKNLAPFVNSEQQFMPGNRSQGVLPPQQFQPAEQYVSPQAGSWKAPDTGDLVQPGSVTEETTKLLNQED